MATPIMPDNLNQNSSLEAAMENEDQNIQDIARPSDELSFPRKLWEKSGLNIGVLILMAKYGRIFLLGRWFIC